MRAANWGPTPSWRSRLRRLLSGADQAFPRPLQLRVCQLQLQVGFLEVRACAEGLGAAAREHPSDAEEQETHGDTAHENEGGQVALGLSFECWQRGEEKIPLACPDLSPGYFDSSYCGEESCIPLFPSVLHTILVVEQRARCRVVAVVDFEVYGGVEGSTESVGEQFIRPEGTDDESSQGTPPFGNGTSWFALPVGRQILLVDRQIHHIAFPQGQVRLSV